ncbi:hypothetical protein RKD42_000323 [Streptomyces ambofaciens]
MGARKNPRSFESRFFMKGEVIKTMPESKIVKTLIEETMKTAEEMDGVPSGEPEVAGSWHPYADKRAASDVTFIGRQRGYPRVFAVRRRGTGSVGDPVG